MKTIHILFALLSVSTTSVFAQTYNGYEYVDLGLPNNVLWAKHNIGASVPEEFGSYYAWGETVPKPKYTWADYVFGADITKYNAIDKVKFLEDNDNVARQMWGGVWRMPGVQEVYQLVINCKRTWVEHDGVYGYEFEGSNGNSIFLPAAGYIDSTTTQGAGTEGHYWLTQCDNDTLAFAFFMNSGTRIWRSTLRYKGCNVRPIVYKATIPTGIDDVPTKEADEKPVPRYNLQGQRVKDDYRGIIVINGRKTIQR